MADYYALLEVARTASPDELKAAYRKLALAYHPDKNPGDRDAEERFKALAAAYAVLSDPHKRLRYDQFGEEGDPFPNGFPSVQEIFGGLFGDLLANARKRKAQGRDVRYTLEIRFEEAALGCEKEIAFSAKEGCNRCEGSGAEQGPARLTKCSSCAGRGEIAVQQGFGTTSKPCRSCQGRGYLVSNPCTGCDGSGQVERKRAFAIKIPPGMADGGVKVVPGQGESGVRGGTPGDLQVMVRVLPHPLFEREGNDILCEVPIRLSQALMGTQVDVPTLEGKLRMKVPPGTQSGTVFRLRGKGIWGKGGRRGDAHVRIVVETPGGLTDADRDRLVACIDGLPQTASPRQADYIAKMEGLYGKASAREE